MKIGNGHTKRLVLSEVPTGAYDQHLRGSIAFVFTIAIRSFLPLSANVIDKACF